MPHALQGIGYNTVATFGTPSQEFGVSLCLFLFSLIQVFFQDFQNDPTSLFFLVLKEWK